MPENQTGTDNQPSPTGPVAQTGIRGVFFGLTRGTKYGLKTIGKKLGLTGLLASVAGTSPEPISKIAAAGLTVISASGKFVWNRLFKPLLIHTKKDPLFGLAVGLPLLIGGLGMMTGAGFVIGATTVSTALVPVAPFLIVPGAALTAYSTGRILADIILGKPGGVSGSVNSLISEGQFMLDKLFAGPSTASINSSAIIGTGGTIAGTSLITLIGVGTLAAAFYIPSVGRPSPWSQNSQYIQVSKTVSFGDISNPTELENEQITDETTFTYTVIITANGADLKDITLNDIVNAAQDNGAFSANPQIPQIPSFLADGSSSPPITYTITTFPRTEFTDSILSNIAIVNATAIVTQPDGSTQEVPNQQSTAETLVIIGSPSQNCPSGWPVAGNPTVSAGPGDIATHQGNHYESIDLSVATGTPVFSTHNGTVKNAGFDSNGYGNYVVIEGICNGIVFTSLYAHLLDYSVTIGQSVHAGQRIALSDNTGNTSGAHLHYEFEDRKLSIRDYTPY